MNASVERRSVHVKYYQRVKINSRPEGRGFAPLLSFPKFYVNSLFAPDGGDAGSRTGRWRGDGFFSSL